MRSVYPALLIASVAGGALRAQPLVIKSETKVVIVDVVATDKKGAYVHDLTAKDFKVWEDNKEQTIESFALEAAAKSAAAPQTDYIVLLFDYGGMDASDQIRARQAAAGFIDANVGPNRRMAVANIDAGLRIAQSFTDNAGRLKEAANGAKAGMISVNNTTAGTSASADLSGRDRFQSLKNVASSMSPVPGRKTIVFLTGSLVAGSDQKGALDEAIDACNRANVAVYPVDVRDVSVPAGFQAQDASTGRVRGPTAMAAGRTGRGGTGLGGDVDPATTADPGGASQQILFTLASRTGGFVIRNASELPGGLQKIGQEQEEYYVLGYTPADSKEGACHALKVKVERAGTNIRARSGYCNGKTEELVTGNAAEKDLAKRAAAIPSGNVGGSMRIPFFYVGADVARVNVAMDIAPDAVKFERRKGSLHADVNILGIASTSDGATGARFNDTLTLDFDEAEQKWKDKPLHYEKEFKIAPGQYTFTVVFSTSGESFGKLAQPLVVQPYQPGQLALSSIALGKEVRKASDGGSTASLFDDRTPLNLGGIEMIPTGSNAFTRPEQAFCYFEVYLASAGAPTVGLRILNAKNGEAAWDGGSQKLEVPAGKTVIPLGLGVPIGPLAPGSYQLEVTAVSGDTKVRRTAGFDIK